MYTQLTFVNKQIQDSKVLNITLRFYAKLKFFISLNFFLSTLEDDKIVVKMVFSDMVGK